MGNATDAVQNDAGTARDSGLSELRSLARALWEFARQIRPAGRFANFEGGSVEQSMNPRLLWRHCLNYAATLAILLRTIGQRFEPEDSGRPALLELGCGSGLLSAAFCRAMPACWDLLATDYSPQLVARARQRYQLPNLRFQVADVRSLSSLRLQRFHAVFFLELIEHLAQDRQRELLAALYEGMRNGGVVVFSTLDRSAFRRPYSGYWPHQIEYTYRKMNEFLSCPENSQFEEYRIWRLHSPRITADAVRAENCGGYVFNRLAGLAERLTAPHPGFREFSRRMVDAVFRLYSSLPVRASFSLDDWLSDVSVDGDSGETSDIGDAFSMVVWMRKI